jgi:two-component system, NarL family, nitrate/nitrite response regulator NarL
MITVAAVEDHPVYRQGLVQAIEAAPEVILVLAARSIQDFETRVPARPDVVLLDLHLPDGMEGVQAVNHLSSRDLAVLVVSASKGATDVLDAIGAGARGYLTKQAEPDEIIRAVRAVAAGGTYVSATLAAYLLKAPIQLTEREREILRLVAGGETDQDIAEQLIISVRTVGSHLDRIRDKTGHRRRADLTRLAIERGIVPRPTREG